MCTHTVSSIQNDVSYFTNGQKVPSIGVYIYIYIFLHVMANFIKHYILVYYFSYGYLQNK